MAVVATSAQPKLPGASPGNRGVWCCAWVLAAGMSAGVASPLAASPPFQGLTETPPNESLQRLWPTALVGSQSRLLMPLMACYDISLPCGVKCGQPPLLTGYRGTPAMDTDALEHLLFRVAELVDDLRDVRA